MSVLLKICCIFSEHLFPRAALEGCFWYNVLVVLVLFTLNLGRVFAGMSDWGSLYYFSEKIVKCAQTLKCHVFLTVMIFSFCSFPHKICCIKKIGNLLKTTVYFQCIRRLKKMQYVLNIWLRFILSGTLKINFSCYNSAIHLTSSIFHSFSLCSYV